MSKQSLENSEFNMEQAKELTANRTCASISTTATSEALSIHAAEGSNVSRPIHKLRPRYNLIIQGDVHTNAQLC